MLVRESISKGQTSDSAPDYHYVIRPCDCHLLTPSVSALIVRAACSGSLFRIQLSRSLCEIKQSTRHYSYPLKRCSEKESLQQPQVILLLLTLFREGRS